MPGSPSINPPSSFSFFEIPDDMELTEQNELTTAPLFLLAVFNNSAVNANVDLMESTRVLLLLPAMNIPNNSAVNANTNGTELDEPAIEPSFYSVNDARDGEVYRPIANAGATQILFFTPFNANVSEELLTRSHDNSETSEECFINSY